jgi:CheY-like chemotaxis protein
MPTQPSDALRVLVVEDDADRAEGLALLFRKQGHVVAVAADGPSVERVRRGESGRPSGS